MSFQFEKDSLKGIHVLFEIVDFFISSDLLCNSVILVNYFNGLCIKYNLTVFYSHLYQLANNKKNVGVTRNILLIFFNVIFYLCAEIILFTSNICNCNYISGKIDIFYKILGCIKNKILSAIIEQKIIKRNLPKEVL
ncbi:hypothetical protein ACSHU8_13775 [Acinetobacter baumannii]|uniref:hypothetical protein n=1 Tax=Acinetobacter baumannii TaxID=470 RepID=UPI0023425935|nr:hypothetical protein [Acinetobacter baumannii]